MANDSFRLPFISVGAAIDADAAKARSAEKDYDKLARAMIKAQETGQKITAKMVSDLNMARQRADELKKIAAANKAAGVGSNASERKYERMAHRFQRVFGDSFFRKLAEGKAPDLRDITRLGVDSMRVALGRSGPLVAMLTELVFKVVDTDVLLKDQKRNLEGVVMEKFRKDGMGKKTFDFIAGDQGTMGFIADSFEMLLGSDPYKKREEKLMKRSILQTMSAPEIDAELATQNKQLTLEQNLTKAGALPKGRKINEDQFTIKVNGKKVTGMQIKAVFEQKLNEQIQKGHGHVAWMDEVAQMEAYASFGITDDLIDKMAKNSAVREEAKRRRPDAGEDFRIRHEQQLFNIAMQQKEKRVAINPHD